VGVRLDINTLIEILIEKVISVKCNIKRKDMDIMIGKEIELVPVVQEDGKLIGVVARLDILRQKLNEGFVTIGERRGIAKT
jgi:predicted transcriptional regulator